MKNMKIAKSLVALGFLSLAVVSASAVPVNVTRYPAYDGGIGGGEFTIYNSPWGAAYDAKAQASYLFPNATGFQTFCLEENEMWSTSPDASLSFAAVQGGVSGGNPDYICVGTAYLYSEFAKGTLAGYDYTAAGRQSSAAALQKAIWWLEGEGANPNNVFSIAASGITGYANNAMGQYDVFVVNMTTVDKTGQRVDKQSMLVYFVPDGGMTLALLGGALSLLGIVRRKF